ncbi:MAG: 50S ribosomal protein L18 [Candidatus Omnitrophica bacterium]|nr:50S ribosomal protein L18 [Candidatus Omnitrophota bacterium]
MRTKKERQLKRHRAFLKKISGTAERPRLVISRSIKHISAQAIDDTVQKSLFSLSTTNKEIKQKIANAGNVKGAQEFGRLLAQRLKEKGITALVFDRSGRLYHGRIKAIAESLREEGIIL